MQTRGLYNVFFLQSTYTHAHNIVGMSSALECITSTRTKPNGNEEIFSVLLSRRKDVCRLVASAVDEDTIFIEKIFTNPEWRRNAYARHLLQCFLGQQSGKTIVLQVIPFGNHPGPDTDQLEAFYKSLGFRPVVTSKIRTTISRLSSHPYKEPWMVFQ